jgi:DNA mismatch repair protein PMS2
METQPLVQLKPLELSNSDVMVIKNNLDVFQRNGFQFEFDDENEHMTNVYLKSIPSIRNYRFDIQDIFMLIEACQDDAYSSILLPKVKGSLASRACRTAIMIGDTLSQNQMSKVVANMALMEQPWNCPHG